MKHKEKGEPMPVYDAATATALLRIADSFERIANALEKRNAHQNERDAKLDGVMAELMKLAQGIGRPPSVFPEGAAVVVAPPQFDLGDLDDDDDDDGTPHC